LPTRLLDVLVGFKKGAKVHGLTAPEVSVDGPVEGELQRAPVEASAVGQLCSCRGVTTAERGRNVQDGRLGAHGDGGPVGGYVYVLFRGRRAARGVAMAGVVGAVDANGVGGGRRAWL
jgi:hypothetical protein